MITTPPSTGALTSLEAAVAALLDGLAPVRPRFVPLDMALGRIGAAMPPLARAWPARDTARTDGWAVHALALAGASSYSPLPLLTAPAWVDAGDPMPDGCDCVLDAGHVDLSGPMPQVFGEASPGQGVRRAGEDMGPDRPLIFAGARLSAADLMVARSLTIQQIAVRVPKVCVIDIAAPAGQTFTARFMADCARGCGMEVGDIQTVGRDVTAIVQGLDGAAHDLVILIGATGAGRADIAAEALGARGALLAHTIALEPGRSAAIGRLDAVPVIALPGAPDQAFAGFLALVQPVLDRLSARAARPGLRLPLVRKIASTVGLAEIVLLKQEQDRWAPLATGDFSLEAMRSADAWLAVPGDSEGHAAETPVRAFLLNDVR